MFVARGTLPDCSAEKAAKQVVERKQNGYQNISETYIFKPVAIGAKHAIVPSTSCFLYEFGRKVVSKIGKRRASEWMYQYIFVAVMRGCAVSFKLFTLDKVKGGTSTIPV